VLILVGAPIHRADHATAGLDPGYPPPLLRRGRGQRASRAGSKADLVTSLGAEHVIDYTQESFVDGKHRYDVVIASAAWRQFQTCAMRSAGG
jgi:hypothetical protein